MGILSTAKNLFMPNNDTIKMLLKGAITRSIDLNAELNSLSQTDIFEELRPYLIYAMDGTMTVNPISRTYENYFIGGRGRSIYLVDGVFMALTCERITIGESVRLGAVITCLSKDFEFMKRFIFNAFGAEDTIGAAIRLQRAGRPWFTSSRRLEEYYRNQVSGSDTAVYREMDNIASNFSTDEYKAQCVSERRQHRHVVLLSGPPGTGKTSLIRHMAVKHGMDVYQSVLDAGCIDALMDTRRGNAPSIVVYEDIDRMIEPGFGGGMISADSENPVPMLMGALDGSRDFSNVIVILTANNPEKLPPALIRHGRVHTKLHLGYLTHAEFCKEVGWEVNGPLHKHFMDNAGYGDKLTMALVQTFKGDSTIDAVNSSIEVSRLIAGESEF